MRKNLDYDVFSLNVFSYFLGDFERVPASKWRLFSIFFFFERNNGMISDTVMEWKIRVSSIGLRGEDTRPNFGKKRFRPFLKEKNIFFIFFSGPKIAKLNFFEKKIIFFRPQFLEKNNKICLFLVKKRHFLTKNRLF